MPDPIEFTLKVENHTWTLARDGEAQFHYSHLESAMRDASRIAREMEETGQPARVLVHAADGKVIELVTPPEVTREMERGVAPEDRTDKGAGA